MSIIADAAPIVTHSNNVVVVQLPFDFETLFTQSIPKQVLEPTSIPEKLDEPPRKEFDLSSSRRRIKTRKSLTQHIEEVDSPSLRLSDSGRNIYCIPCGMDLTEYGKVKKSSIKLHLQCKRHLYNLKAQEKAVTSRIPTEVKRDDVAGLFKCTLCGKAISNDLHDVRRHCAGKRHQRLLITEGVADQEGSLDVAGDIVMEEQGKESLSQPKPMSARDHNNEFVYDVLDLVMNTHMNLAWIEPLRNLLTKWTTMKLPSAATIKRNHLPRYLELNPDVAEKRSEVIRRRIHRKRLLQELAMDELNVETILPADGPEEKNDDDKRPVGSPTVVDAFEMEHANNDFIAEEGQIFSMADFPVQQNGEITIIGT